MESQFMDKKRTDIPPELLSKEFLKQFSKCASCVLQICFLSLLSE